MKYNEKISKYLLPFDTTEKRKVLDELFFDFDMDYFDKVWCVTTRAYQSKERKKFKIYDMRYGNHVEDVYYVLTNDGLLIEDYYDISYVNARSLHLNEFKKYNRKKFLYGIG